MAQTRTDAHGVETTTAAELRDLEDALDIALKLDVTSLSASECGHMVRHVDRLKSKLDALDANAIGAFDTSKQWDVDNTRSPSSWIQRECRRSSNDANRRVRRARRLRKMPLVSDALTEGRVNSCQVDQLSRVCRPGFEDAFTEYEQFFLDQTAVLDHTEMTKLLQYWEDAVDPDGANRRSGEKTDRRQLNLSRTLNGMGRIDGWLDPIDYDIYNGEVSRIEQQMWKQDWAEAKERLGRNPHAGELCRTVGQRRLDAAVEMANRSSQAEDGGKRPKPVVHVHTNDHTFIEGLKEYCGLPHRYDPAQMMCELGDGTHITPLEVVEQALMGHVKRVVYDSPSILLDVGHSQEFFTGALRDAIMARDRECTEPGCHVRAARCEVDHIHERQHGGVTSAANGELRCPFHHRRKHRQ